jgi:hypothetical protein
MDCFPALFNRKREDDSLGLATGERMTHLNCLLGRLVVPRSTDAGGVNWYRQNPDTADIE